MGRDSTPARKISFVSLVAYGPKVSDSALTMGVTASQNRQGSSQHPAKENISKMKRESTVWENKFSNDTSDKGLISKYIKNSHDSTPGRQTTQLKMGKGPELTPLQ